ncbi:hypothetical protein [Cupriavidus sp. OTU4054]|uniref:hypothetical protein n=1 Tax=Cupriavidus sp. OTU4054 TaxID=3043853 RepID=UPI00313B8C77
MRPFSEWRKMIDCEHDVPGEFEPESRSNLGEDCRQDEAPQNWIPKFVDLRSPAERGQIPDYVLTQMSHRPDGLLQDQTRETGQPQADLLEPGKTGRRQHDVRATGETTFGPIPQRVSDVMLRRYRWAVDSLWRRVVAEDEGAIRHRPVGPLEIVDLLLRRVPELRNSTFNTTRAAVLYWLDGMHDSSEAMQARVILLTGCPKDGFKGPKPGTTATRYSTKSQRKRTFARRDFDRLLRYLDKQAESSSNHLAAGALVAAWLRAGLAAGLRPVEWVEAVWSDESQSHLRVKTAKQRRQEADWTAGLARLEREPDAITPEDSQQPAKYRLVSIDESDRPLVNAFMTKVRTLLNAGEEFPAIYSRARQYLWRSSIAVFGKGRQRFTLYQMRGQFGSNRKARQGVSATAEEMGNAPSKASGYYGKAIYSHRSARGGGDKPADRETDSGREMAGLRGTTSGTE